MFLKIDNVGAERTPSGRLFWATGPATQHARLSGLVGPAAAAMLTHSSIKIWSYVSTTGGDVSTF